MISSRYHVTRYEFQAFLRYLGPLTTPVRVNGQPLLLGAVIDLLERLPEETRFGAQGRELFIDPDPFVRAPAAPKVDPDAGPTSAELVRRLIARQEVAERRDQPEPRGLWARLRRTLA